MITTIKNTLLIIFVLSIYSLSAQDYFKYSKTELVKLKQAAVTNSDYAKAANIKAEINFRDSLKIKVEELEKAKAKAIEIEDFKVAEALNNKVKQLKSYDRLRASLIEAVNTSNFKKAKQIKDQLLAVRYGTDKLNEKQNKPQNKEANQDVTSGELLIINKNNFTVDILIDSKWVASLKSKEKALIKNLTIGQHLLTAGFTEIARMPRFDFPFEYDGSAIEIGIPKMKPKHILKSYKSIKKGKTPKYIFEPVFNTSVASKLSDMDAEINLNTFEPPVKRITTSSFNYAKGYTNLNHYFLDFPQDATSKFKINAANEFTHNLPGFNGLFWSYGFGYYFSSYVMPGRLLSGVFIDGQHFESGYNIELNNEFMSFNTTAAFGYQLEASSNVTVYSSLKVLPTFSYIKTESVSTKTSSTSTIYKSYVETYKDRYFSVGATLNIGALVFISKKQRFGLLGELVVNLRGGGVGFNIGFAQGMMRNTKYKYVFYE